MSQFFAFFVLTCSGATCHWSAPVRDQATADQMRQDAELRWFNGRVEVWADECREIQWNAAPSIDAFFSLQSAPAKAVGCERTFVSGSFL